MVKQKNFNKIFILLLSLSITFFTFGFVNVNAASEYVDITNLGYREWKNPSVDTDFTTPFEVPSFSSFIDIFPSSGIYTMDVIFFSGVNMESQFSAIQIDNNQGNISYVSSSSSGSGATSVMVFTAGAWTDLSYSRVIFFPAISSGQSLIKPAYDWLIECTKPFNNTSLVGSWYANNFIRPISYDSTIDFDWYGSFTIDNVNYIRMRFFGTYQNFQIRAFTDTNDTFGTLLYSSNSYWVRSEYRYLIVNSITNTPADFINFFLLNYTTFTSSTLIFSINGWYAFLPHPVLPDTSLEINITFSSNNKIYNKILVNSSRIEYIFYNYATNNVAYSDIVYLQLAGSSSTIDWSNDNFRYLFISPAKINSITRSFMLSNGTFDYSPPQTSSIKDLIFAFIDVPIRTLSSLLSFEVLGTAAFSIFCSFILVALAIFVLKKVV